jgi:hypothetical protein
MESRRLRNEAAGEAAAGEAAAHTEERVAPRAHAAAHGAGEGRRPGDFHRIRVGGTEGWERYAEYGRERAAEEEATRQNAWRLSQQSQLSSLLSQVSDAAASQRAAAAASQQAEEQPQRAESDSVSPLPSMRQQAQRVQRAPSWLPQSLPLHSSIGSSVEDVQERDECNPASSSRSVPLAAGFPGGSQPQPQQMASQSGVAQPDPLSARPLAWAAQPLQQRPPASCNLRDDSRAAPDDTGHGDGGGGAGGRGSGGRAVGYRPPPPPSAPPGRILKRCAEDSSGLCNLRMPPPAFRAAQPLPPQATRMPNATGAPPPQAPLPSGAEPPRPAQQPALPPTLMPPTMLPPSPTGSQHVGALSQQHAPASLGAASASVLGSVDDLQVGDDD